MEAPSKSELKEVDAEVRELLDKEISADVNEEVLSGVTGGIPVEVQGETKEDRNIRVDKLRQEAINAAGSAHIANDAPVKEFMPAETSEEKPIEKSLKSKILSFFGQAPEQLSSKYSKLGEERMKGNPALRQAYEKYLSTEGKDVAEAYKEAIGKWTYIARDKDGNFVDKTVYSVASGEVNKE